MSNTITVGQFVTTQNGDNAFVSRIDEKSQRAVLIFVDEGVEGFGAMRRLTTLEPVKHANGRLKKVKNVRAAVAAARAGQPVA